MTTPNANNLSLHPGVPFLMARCIDNIKSDDVKKIACNVATVICDKQELRLNILETAVAYFSNSMLFVRKNFPLGLIILR